LKNLDEAGIVYIGAEVNPAIFWSQGHAEGESPMTPKEKLRAPSSAKRRRRARTRHALAAGVTGTIVEVRFSRSRRGEGPTRHRD
jgi:DNA-directed RNA polymerase subunit beta